MHMHIGSQIKTTNPCHDAVVQGKGGEIVARLRKMGGSVAWCDMGGGFAINDRGHQTRPIAEFAKRILPGIQAKGCRFAMDPGRVLAGNAGILASRVLYTKQSGEKRFLIQDAAMNDLIRPALSASFPRVGPVTVPVGRPARPSRRLRGRDRGDRALGRGRTWTHVLRERRPPGQRLCLLPCPGSTGTICWRPSRQAPLAWSWPPTTTRATEILVDGVAVRLARRRETDGGSGSSGAPVNSNVL
ncbi:hypothetical protein [Singulisphaera acidiphila]|uniref:hypothetical protein n=1 Tax=Singulisphaera acidiphila TaxID=466153 RepID=UPI000693B038|nr:hypothetical protein [Singulisphaera acidiphila]